MQASGLAKTLVKCGLSRIGIVDEEHLPESTLDTEIRFILAEQEKQTQTILQPFKDDIARFASHIVDEESIDGAEFRVWLDDIRQSNHQPMLFAPDAESDTHAATADPEPDVMAAGFRAKYIPPLGADSAPAL